MRIGISSLGQTWLIIPEVLGFLDPGWFDFYQNHPERNLIEEVRQQNGIQGIDELWVITTTDTKTREAFDKNVQWLKSLPSHPVLRGWACEGIPDLNTPEQCRKMRNLIHLIVLTAHRHARTEGSGSIHISLAGGRKTISADLQDAAFYFGCSNLVHVIDRPPASDSRQSGPLKLEPDDLRMPPSMEQVQRFFPVRTAQYPYLDLSVLEREFAPFNLDLPAPFQLLEVPTDTRLIDTIEKKTKQAFFFFENLLTGSSTVMEDRRNFFYLFTLSPSLIHDMRTHTITGTEQSDSHAYRFLQRLPKAELHCHLGGVLDVSEAIQVASLLQKHVDQYRKRNSSFKEFLQTLRVAVKEKNVSVLRAQVQNIRSTNRKQTFSGDGSVPSYIQTAGVLLAFQEHPSLLEEVWYGPYLEPEHFAGIGIQAYEQLGDLQGSALLQTEAAIRKAVSLAVKKAVRENVRYLELRCSPWNYTKGELTDGLSAYRVIAEALKAEVEKVRSPRYDEPAPLLPNSVPVSRGAERHPRMQEPRLTRLRARILLIASRHRKMSEVYQYIELVKEIYQKGIHADLLAGIDLAGDEKQASPQRLREAFLDVMDYCPYVTIHAGETQKAQSVWGAVYHLNAERIGHGLTLKDNQDLLRKVIDRGIALEMCPSSNHQIIGFIAHTYPLKDYLQQGVRVTINTDNPGISRTNLTKEYLQAARLSPGGLSILQIFQLVKNGFSAAFLPLTEREQLLWEVEQELSTLPLLPEEV